MVKSTRKRNGKKVKENITSINSYIKPVFFLSDCALCQLYTFTINFYNS